MIGLVFLAIGLMIAPFWSHAEEISSSRVYVASCVAMEPWESAPPRISAYCSFLTRLGQAADVPLESVPEPLARAIASLRDGSVDITILARADNREGAGIEICTPVTVRLLLAFRKGDDDWRRRSLLQGKRFAAPGSDHFFEPYRTAGAFQENVNTMTQGFKMLAAGRVDAVACAMPGCVQAMQEAHFDASKLDFLTVEDVALSVLVARSSPLASNDAALKRLRLACARPAWDIASTDKGAALDR